MVEEILEQTTDIPICDQRFFCREMDEVAEIDELGEEKSSFNF